MIEWSFGLACLCGDHKNFVVFLKLKINCLKEIDRKPKKIDFKSSAMFGNIRY